jgi:ribosome-binding factor A
MSNGSCITPRRLSLVAAFMNSPGYRVERVAHEIRVVLAEMIARELKDPRIGFATLTRVELTADLHHARVLVSVLGSPDEQQGTIEGLAAAAGFIRHAIGRRLTLRRVPELTFVLDKGAKEADRIETLLQELQLNHEVKDKG